MQEGRVEVMQNRVAVERAFSVSDASAAGATAKTRFLPLFTSRGALSLARRTIPELNDPNTLPHTIRYAHSTDAGKSASLSSCLLSLFVSLRRARATHAIVLPFRAAQVPESPALLSLAQRARAPPTSLCVSLSLEHDENTPTPPVLRSTPTATPPLLAFWPVDLHTPVPVALLLLVITHTHTTHTQTQTIARAADADALLVPSLRFLSRPAHAAFPRADISHSRCLSHSLSRDTPRRSLDADPRSTSP